MEDVLFIAGTVAFFALGVAYIRFCDRIIGPDSATPAVEVEPARKLVEVGS